MPPLSPITITFASCEWIGDENASSGDMKLLNCHLKGGDIVFMAVEVKPQRLCFKIIFNFSDKWKAMLIPLEKGKQINLSVSAQLSQKINPTLPDWERALFFSGSPFPSLSEGPLYPLHLEQMVWCGDWSAALLARPDRVTPVCQGFPHKTLAAYTTNSPSLSLNQTK